MNRNLLRYIIILLHLLFMCKQLFFGNSLLQDSREYLYAADNLLNEGRLYAWNLNHAFNPDWLTKRPVLYPVILAIFKVLSGGNLFLFLLLLYGAQNLLSLFSLNLAMQMATKLGARISPMRTLFFLLFSVSQFIYANLIMCEIWLQCCMVCSVYVMMFHEETYKKYLLIAVLLTTAVGLKPVMMFAAWLFPAAYVFFRFRNFSLPRFLICLIPAVYITMVSLANGARTGYRHYSSISNINLLHYNLYSTLLNCYGQEKADSLIDDIHTRAQVLPDYAEEQKLIRSESIRLLREHAGTYIRLHIRGMAFSLTDPGRFDLTQFFGLPHKGNLLYESNKGNWLQSLMRVFTGPAGMMLLVLLAFNCYRLFVVIRFVFQNMGRPDILIPLLAFPAYLITLTGPIGTSRFFMPLIPIVFVMFLLQGSKKNKTEV